MSKKIKSIPLNTFPENLGPGIILMKASIQELQLEQFRNPHRDNYHLFFLLEQGSGIFEIDFRQYEMVSPSVIYIQPFQVHRGIYFQEGVFSVLMISSENINPEYLALLKEIAPADPLLLSREIFSQIAEIVTLSMKIYRDTEIKLYHPVLRDSCNSAIGFIVSQFLSQSFRADQPTRFEVITKEFKFLLDEEFSRMKSPSQFAERLNISVPYLNECVKKTTGQPVTYHIQERVILEAKRLLFHSSQSVKEIAYALGYEDYSYFSRLFMKVTGATALEFRNRNLE